MTGVQFDGSTVLPLPSIDLPNVAPLPPAIDGGQEDDVMSMVGGRPTRRDAERRRHEFNDSPFEVTGEPPPRAGPASSAAKPRSSWRRKPPVHGRAGADQISAILQETGYEMPAGVLRKTRDRHRTALISLRTDTTVQRPRPVLSEPPRALMWSSGHSLCRTKKEEPVPRGPLSFYGQSLKRAKAAKKLPPVHQLDLSFGAQTMRLPGGAGGSHSASMPNLSGAATGRSSAGGMVTMTAGAVQLDLTMAATSQQGNRTLSPSHHGQSLPPGSQGTAFRSFITEG